MFSALCNLVSAYTDEAADAVKSVNDSLSESINELAEESRQRVQENNDGEAE